MDDVEFTITEGALGYIVGKAVEYKLGARGLRSLCEAIFTDAMFDLPSSDEKEFKYGISLAEQKEMIAEENKVELDELKLEKF